MPPTPLPPPPPPVEVNVPPGPAPIVNVPEPVHSSGDWWYTQGATAIGVLIALVAAGIAFWAVSRQVKSAKTGVEMQIAAAREDAKRQQLLDLLERAHEYVRRVEDTCRPGNIPNLTQEQQAAFLKDIDLEARLIKVRLKLFGQVQVVQTLDFVSMSVSAALHTRGTSTVTSNVDAARKAIEEAMADALPSDDTGGQPSAGTTS